MLKFLHKLSEKIEKTEVKKLQRVILGVVFIFVWGLMTHAKYSGTGDEPHYMMIAHSLVFDRDLEISNNYNDRSNIICDGNLTLADAHAQKGRNRRLYPVHDIGMPLTFSPYFAFAYWVSEKSSEWVPSKVFTVFKMNRWSLLKGMMSLAMVILTGILAGYIFELALYFTGLKARSFFLTILFVLSPPLLSHSYLFFTEICSALLAFYIYREFKIEKFLSKWNYLAIGFLTGYLFIVHVRNIGLMFGLLIFALLKASNQQQARVFTGHLICGFLTCFLFRTAINFYLWERVLTTPHATWSAYTGLSSTLSEITIRFMEWLFDKEHGLLPYAPIYIVALAGFFKAYQISRNIFFEILFLILSYLIPVSIPFINPHGWRGGWSPAARFLVPIIPFVILGMSFYFKGRSAIPWIVRLLILIQIVFNLIFWQFPKLLWEDGDGTSKFLLFLGGG